MPRSLVLQADWAFGRYFDAAMRSATTSEERLHARRTACVFGGAARRAKCAERSLDACLPRSNVHPTQLTQAIVWLCEKADGLRLNCSDLLMRACIISEPYTSLNRMLHDADVTAVASVLFTAHYHGVRCSSPNLDAACFFQGSAASGSLAELQAILSNPPSRDKQYEAAGGGRIRPEPIDGRPADL